MARIRTICWFSAGAASAVATKIILGQDSDAIPVRCNTGSEHPDNDRFMRSCEKWFGVSVESIKSNDYKDTWAVWEKRRYLAGISGAPCTVELKVGPRLEFQRPNDIHVFGYTADSNDVARAKRLVENYPELTIKTPLIDRGITKQGCLSIIKTAGLSPPLTYAQGFPNANCIPCVKATSASYWALIRKHYPEQFDRMVKLSRELNVRLCRIDGERCFIDEIPLSHPTTNPIVPACDFLCHIAEMDIDK